MEWSLQPIASVIVYLLVVSKGERRCSEVSDRFHRRQVTFISGEVTFTEVKSPILKGTLRPPHRKLSVHHLNPSGYDETLRELESRECNGVTFGNQRYPSARNGSADLLPDGVGEGKVRAFPTEQPLRRI